MDCCLPAGGDFSLSVVTINVLGSSDPAYLAGLGVWVQSDNGYTDKYLEIGEMGRAYDTHLLRRDCGGSQHYVGSLWLEV